MGGRFPTKELIEMNIFILRLTASMLMGGRFSIKRLQLLDLAWEAATQSLRCPTNT
jgi:hypothetical protein